MVRLSCLLRFLSHSIKLDTAMFVPCSGGHHHLGRRVHFLFFGGDDPLFRGHHSAQVQEALASKRGRGQLRHHSRRDHLCELGTYCCYTCMLLFYDVVCHAAADGNAGAAGVGGGYRWRMLIWYW